METPVVTDEQTAEPLMRPGLTPPQIRALMGRLSANRVANRSQGGRQLSYLEAYDVKATLIRIFGFGGFSAETIHTQVLRLEQQPGRSEGSQMQWNATAICTVRLTIHALGAVYQESASSDQSNPQPGEAVDFAIKTAESDALKRAATYLGTQFGLGLYDNGSTAEIVRILIEPEQAAMWAASQPQAPAETPEQAAALAQSVGVQNDAQAPAQPAEEATHAAP
jgi:recombination DNA repair RAD52 pathway protein